MPHHIQIWPRRLPKCLKIHPWRPKSAITSKSGPRDLQNALKPAPGHPIAHYLKFNAWINPQRPKSAISSKSGPGDLQNASKSTRGRPSAHQLKIWSWRLQNASKWNLRGPSPPSPRNLALENVKILQNRPWDAQVPIISV